MEVVVVVVPHELKNALLNCFFENICKMFFGTCCWIFCACYSVVNCFRAILLIPFFATSSKSIPLKKTESQTTESKWKEIQIWKLGDDSLTSKSIWNIIYWSHKLTRKKNTFWWVNCTISKMLEITIQMWQYAKMHTHTHTSPNMILHSILSIQYNSYLNNKIYERYILCINFV